MTIIKRYYEGTELRTDMFKKFFLLEMIRNKKLFSSLSSISTIIN